MDAQGSLVTNLTASSVSFSFDGGATWHSLAAGTRMASMSLSGSGGSSVSEISGEYFTLTAADYNGMITARLTSAGLAALRAGEHIDEMLTISVDGFEYSMPLVINESHNYNFAPEETHADLGDELAAEWYETSGATVAGKDIILGGSAYNWATISLIAEDGYSATALQNSSVDTTAGKRGGGILVFAASETADATAVETNSGFSSYGMEMMETRLTAGDNSTVIIHADAWSGWTRALYTSNYDEHFETRTAIQTGSGGSVDISSTSNDTDGRAFGIATYSEVANALSATTVMTDGAVRIGAEAANDRAWGLETYANGSQAHASAEINGSGVNITASGKRNTTALRAGAYDGGTALNDIKGDSDGVTISADSLTYSAWGLSTYAEGSQTHASTEISGSGVNIAASGGANVTTLYAGANNGGTALNDIKAGSGGVTISAEAVSQAYGMSASGSWDGQSSAANRVDSGGDITVNCSTQGTEYNSTVLLALGGGRNTLNADNGSITISSVGANGPALGLYAEGEWARGSGGVDYDASKDTESWNSLTAGDDITIEVTSGTANKDAEAAGIQSNENAANYLESTNGSILVNVSAPSGGRAFGVFARNTLTAFEDIIVNVKGTAGASGLTRAVTCAAGGSVAVDAYTERGDACGVEVFGGANALITALDVDIRSVSDEGDAYGLCVAGGNSKTTAGTFADNVHVGATAGANAYAMYVGNKEDLAKDDILNTIETGEAVLSATGTAGAYGMYARGVGGSLLSSNTIRAGGDALTVTLATEAETDAADTAFALWAEGVGASNNIIGGDGDDRISLVGDIHAARSGVNTIDTGDGNDVISLHGKVDSATALSLDAGGGYDTLVLTASDSFEFKDYYQTWLADNFSDMHVEAIHVNTGDNTMHMSAIQNFFYENSSLFEDISLTYLLSDHSLSKVLYSDGYLNEDGRSILALGDFMSTVDLDIFSALDMGGFTANSLLISVNDLDEINGLMIRGDYDDTLTLGGAASDWTKSDNGEGYDIYTYNDTGTELLVMQQSLAVIFNG